MEDLELPENLETVLTVFYDIHLQRHTGLNGPEPLDHEVIAKYLEREEIEFSAWEKARIIDLDRLYRTVIHQNNQKRKGTTASG